MTITQYKFANVSVDEIKVGKRIRQDLGDVESLAKSIADLGLLYPIMVTPDCQLVDGRRRLAAIRLLRWSEVPVMMVYFEKELMAHE